MRTSLAAAFAALALAASAAAHESAGAKFPVERTKTVRSLIELQTDLFNAERWGHLWLTFSSSFRRSCDFKIWKAHVAREHGDRAGEQVTDVRVRAHGNRALAAYTVRRNGRVVFQVRFSDLDVYVRIGPRWYDAPDRHTEC